MPETLDHDIAAIERRANALVVGHRMLMTNLIAMRTKHGLTQAQVAERMGVSQPTVAAFERYDSNPTLATIRRYALAVEAQIEERVIDDCAPNTSTTIFGVTAIDAPAPQFQRGRTRPHMTPAAWAAPRAGVVRQYA